MSILNDAAKIFRGFLKELTDPEEPTKLQKAMNIAKIVQASGNGIASLGDAGEYFVEAAARVSGNWEVVETGEKATCEHCDHCNK